MAAITQIIVPLLRTVEEAKQLVQSAKFPPVGQRGFGSPIALERFNPVPSFTEYLQQANDALLTIVQIETKEALESIDEIAAVDGIDVLFIGPFDLGKPCPVSRSLQTRQCTETDISYLVVLIYMIGNNIGEPIIDGVVTQTLKDAIAKVLDASHRAGKKCGIYSTSGEQANQFAGQGFDMITVATDYTTLGFAVQESLSIAKGVAKPKKGGSY